MPSDCCYFVDKASAAGAAPALNYFGSILHCPAVFTQNLGQTLSFTSLQTNSKKLSSETYYISNEDAMLTINSCTWSPSSQDVKIGWYNVDNKVTYTVTYDGGDISSKKINSSGVPNGDYKVCIINAGSKSITGALQYEVK